MPFDGADYDARQIYGRAADLLKERGWCRGYLESRGRLCLLGALAVASGRQAHEARHLPQLADLARGLGFAAPFEAAIWNNQPGLFGRRRVIKRLRQAAAEPVG